MSHTVKINVVYKDLSALKTAFQSFGWTIKENSKIRSYYGQEQHTFPYAAINPQKQGYDIGLTPSQDGTIDVKTDFFDRSIETQLGKDLAALTQKYACQVIEDEYIFQGYTVDYEQLKNGTVKLTVRK